MKTSTKIKFYLLWWNAKIFGHLPFRIQYLFSDFLYLILYYIIGYRKKVVGKNLLHSFPEKSEKERLGIEKRFYRHLADIFVETIMLASFSEKEMRERMIYTNIEVFQKFNNEHPTIAAMGHYGAWEYTIGYSLNTTNPVKAVYHPLKDQAVELFYHKMRSRFGTKPIPMKDTAREVITETHKGNNCIVALIADQTPPKPLIKNWIPFLHQPTPFIMGMEKLALKFNMPVIFMDIQRVKRGYYSVTFSVLYDGKEKVEELEITRRYAAILEKIIRRTPHLWIWSHKRWKHKPENL